jgi:predicted metal-dependent HD superfamily phosphohydrolase
LSLVEARLAIVTAVCWDGAVELAERWPLDGADAVRDALLDAYGDQARGYHDLRHLTEVLDRLDELSANDVRFEPLPVRLAAWFHDAVYDGLPGAEERSAGWAREALARVVDPSVAAEVERLVLLTTDHATTEGDDNGAALCDADLAILAAPHDRYSAYVADVRREYAHLTDEEFSTGRAAVLRGLGSRRPLFATAYGEDRWEPAARENLARELAELD